MFRHRITWLTLFFLLFALGGYFREFFFVHLNNIMFMKYYHSTSPLAVAPVMQVFQGFSYDTLYYSKYLFTLCWVIIYFFLNYWVINKFTSDPLFTRFLLYAYLGMLVLSAFSMVYGYFVNHHWDQDEYTLSRWLMGIAQSPLVGLILLAASKLSPKMQTTKDTEEHNNSNT